MKTGSSKRINKLTEEQEEIYVYRLLHVPTGLYYQSIKGRFSDTRTNLGPNGKVYIAREPKFKDLGSISVSLSQALKHGLVLDDWGSIEKKEKDFKIIKFKLVEVK